MVTGYVPTEPRIMLYFALAKILPMKWERMEIDNMVMFV